MSKKTSSIFLFVFLIAAATGFLHIFSASPQIPQRNQDMAGESTGATHALQGSAKHSPSFSGQPATLQPRTPEPETKLLSKAAPHLRNARIDNATAQALHQGNLKWANFQQEFYKATTNEKLTFARVAAAGGNMEVLKGIIDSGYLLPDQMLVVANSALRAGHTSLTEAFIARGTPINGAAGEQGMLEALLLNKRELSEQDILTAAFLAAKGGFLPHESVAPWINNAKTADKFRLKIERIEATGLHIPIKNP